MHLKRLQRSLPALVIVGTLLCASWIGAQRHQGRPQDYGASTPHDDSAAGAAPSTVPAVRRLRASLSVPYFSFARTLRPRS
ncbi:MULTISPECIES: hypothetical protein [Xanthomonas]|uniref:hypothetical protein n=1 Tax=Xanthomonas TaxID=338 RepID=UPI001ADCB67C|nr:MULTISPECIES: hypothetical protein [unclassified Xanthomonas]MBO9874232.1 hypothetical protein [Xanthomonas sp. D-93]WNH46608.1 hypothetical protein PG878_09250 [Xanthomonas sp. A6251]